MMIAFWSFEPRIPIFVWWSLVLICIGALAAYWFRRDQSIGTIRRSILTVLLGMSVVGPLLIALNPTWVEEIPPTPGRPLVSVYVDQTMSMEISDVDDRPNQTRQQSAIAAAAQIGESTETVDVRKSAFDTDVHPLVVGTQNSKPSSNNEDASPRGHRSDLTAVLREGIRNNTESGQAIVLISDGAHNVGSVDSVLSAAYEAKSLDIPIYTVTLGKQVGSQNLSLAARSPRMIAFADHPLSIKVRVGHSGLEGESTQVALMQGNEIVQTRTVRLGKESNQEIRFVMDRPPEQRLTRFRIMATPIAGEATELDNQSSVLVQRLDEPIGAILLEGKPYWDSKFLAANLGTNPTMQLTSLIRVSDKRFLRKKYPRPELKKPDPSSTKDEPEIDIRAAVENVATDWMILDQLESPLEDMETLEQYRVVILGRDAEVFLSPRGLQNLMEWINTKGGCLVCSRGEPVRIANAKLNAMLPIEWSEQAESRFRTKISQYGFDSAVFDSLTMEGDPLSQLPSLSTANKPTPRLGLPQVLLQSISDATGKNIPVVTYQPVGSGQTIVVEGAGMWRWAFLAPQFADKEKIYATLWQSLVQWIISQQDLMPGQSVAIRPDRATFLTGDKVTASLLVRDRERFLDANGKPNCAVLMYRDEASLPKRFVPIPTEQPEMFRVDFGALDVGYFTATVVQGDKEETLAETAIEVRDPWFEKLEADSRPDLMRRIAMISGGEALRLDQVGTIVDRFEQRLYQNRPPQIIRTTIWDRPIVMFAILGAWITSWIVRRRNGSI